MKRLLLWSLLIQYLNSLRLFFRCSATGLFIVVRMAVSFVHSFYLLFFSVYVFFVAAAIADSFFFFFIHLRKLNKHQCSMFETNNAVIGLSRR